MYLLWFWKRQVRLRSLDGCCSLLLGPWGWLFPLARVDGRWIALGPDVKPARLRVRLGLPPLDEAVCFVVEAGRTINGLDA